MATKVVKTTTKEEHAQVVPEGERPNDPIAKPANPNYVSPEDDGTPKNSVGQRLDSAITESNDAYVTPDGKIMIVQMEEADQYFAGENGRNAKWYPKEVVKGWTKKSK